MRERPIETILSGPAASVAGARWLSGATEALVADIGGTTTDICLLRGGRPALDPQGAEVGGWRTMVQAVAMRTTGLGGDSEVHLEPGLAGGLRLGPRRVIPLALAAHDHPEAVHRMLDAALAQPAVTEAATRLVLPLAPPPADLPEREAGLARRLDAGPLPLARLIRQRIETPALDRLVARGVAMIADVTPSDAAHVLDRQSGWDRAAAEKGLALMARRRRGDGQVLAAGPAAMAEAILAALAAQTVEAVLTAALWEDGRFPGPDTLSRHPLLQAALDRGPGLVALSARLGVPLVGLGASARCHYPAVAARLGCALVVPDGAEVANAVGAVVGQVEVAAEGLVTCPGPGLFLAHLPDGVERFADLAPARARLAAALEGAARARALKAGLDAPALALTEELVSAEVEGQRVPVEVRMRMVASGRPEIATAAA